MRSYSTSVLSLIQKTTCSLAFVVCFWIIFPLSAFAASFSFTPASGTYSVGSTFAVGVYVGSQDRAMNAASGVVSYPEDLLEVTSISKNQSQMSLWVQEPSFSNTSGTVNYEGVVLNPGYTGAQGKVVTITFKVKAQGTASLSFTSGSILANDGAGTEILSSKGSAQFTLTPKPTPEVVPAAPIKEVSIPAIPAPKIDSTTHVLDGWSNQATGTFNFAVGNGVTAMRLLLDDTPNSIPTVVYAPPIPRKEIHGITEGISYLHVQYKNGDGWGTITHYKLQVDTQLPEGLTVQKVDGVGTLTDTATFTLNAHDAHSGIDHYEIQIDGATAEHVVSQGIYTYTTPKGLVAGIHSMVVKAFDKGGNFVSTTADFVTTAPNTAVSPVPTIVSEPSLASNAGPFVQNAHLLITALSVVIPLVALILVLSWLLYATWKVYGGLKKKIAAEVLDTKMIMHKAFALIRDDITEDIQTLKKASTKRKLTREEAKILKRLQQNINEAEKVITSEITAIEHDVL